MTTDTANSQVPVIEICMGSSCFARGNEKNLNFIEDYLSRHNLEARVELIGNRCENLCCQGPNIRVNGKLYQGVDRGMILDIFQSLGLQAGQ